MKPKHLITGILCALCLLIASCAPVSQRQATPELPAATYLKLAQTADNPQKQSYLLSAADRFLQDRQLTEANRVLTGIDTTVLTPQLQIRYQLAQSKFYVLHHDAQQALNVLLKVRNNPDLNDQQRLVTASLLAMVYQSQGKLLATLDQYNQMLSYTDDSATQQDILMQTWDYLQTQPYAKLQQYLNSDDLTPLMRGWITLAETANTPSNAELSKKLQQWRQQFPAHPANALLPNTLNQALPDNSKQVALMLPLSGPLGASGTAIKNGFFAAYYQDKKQNPNTANVTVIDTGSGHIGELYQKAVQQGADMIIGPLTKTNVSQLTELNQLPVRTLALNTLNTAVTDQPKLYQFGLTPLDEVQQVVNRAWQDNHTRAIVIAPNSEWGKTIASAFKNQWQQQGGSVVAELSFQQISGLSAQIRRLLNIDQAQSRYQRLKQTIRKQLRFIPYRRQDVDMFFIAAQPNAARQIRPLLKYYYAGSVPVYAPSSIYAGTANTRLDRDLNGIFFCDMPWVIDPSQTLPANTYTIRETVAKLWPKSFKQNTKLYALGVDAYHLVDALNKLTLLPKFGISGATGRLYLSNDQRIYRRLLWAQMRNSKPNRLH